MEIKLSLALPREEVSVPVVRRVLASSLSSLGVSPEVVSDIQLALTEACTNVLDHAQGGEEYEVSAGIDGDLCVIEVVDRGGGFDASARGLGDADTDAEEGRGIQLMRALVDRIEFTNRPQVGAVVHLEKQLELVEGAPLELLSQPTEHGPWTDGDDAGPVAAPR